MNIFFGVPGEEQKKALPFSPGKCDGSICKGVSTRSFCTDDNYQHAVVIE